jgi:hypothetical protein
LVETRGNETNDSRETTREQSEVREVQQGILRERGGREKSCDGLCVQQLDCGPGVWCVVYGDGRLMVVVVGLNREHNKATQERQKKEERAA